MTRLMMAKKEIYIYLHLCGNEKRFCVIFCRLRNAHNFFDRLGSAAKGGVAVFFFFALSRGAPVCFIFLSSKREKSLTGPKSTPYLHRRRRPLVFSVGPASSHLGLAVPGAHDRSRSGQLCISLVRLCWLVRCVCSKGRARRAALEKYFRFVPNGPYIFTCPAWHSDFGLVKLNHQEQQEQQELR